jgi:hypothetical protein
MHMTFFLMHHMMKKLTTCFKRKFCNCTAEEGGKKSKMRKKKLILCPERMARDNNSLGGGCRALRYLFRYGFDLFFGFQVP